MNIVILTGRLTKKPELEYTAGNTPVTRFSIAVDRNKKDAGADFVRITVFGKQAESTCRYMDKGRQIAISGRIQTGSYDKDGRTVYTTDIVADHVEFLGSAERREADEPKYEPRYSDYDDFTPSFMR